MVCSDSRVKNGNVAEMDADIFEWVAAGAERVGGVAMGDGAVAKLVGSFAMCVGRCRLYVGRCPTLFDFALSGLLILIKP